MPEQPKKTTLKDVINYAPDVYISENDLEFIRLTFKDNDRLIKLLRKLLLPSALDPELPIEEMNGDVWLADLDFKLLPTEQVKAIVLGRQEAIKMVLGALIKIKVLANHQPLTPEQVEANKKKDDTR